MPCVAPFDKEERCFIFYGFTGKYTINFSPIRARVMSKSCYNSLQFCNQLTGGYCYAYRGESSSRYKRPWRYFDFCCMVMKACRKMETFTESVIIVFHTILERLVNSSENHDHKHFLDSFKYNDQATVFAEEPKMIFPH